jgi:hypothetical protein
MRENLIENFLVVIDGDVPEILMVGAFVCVASIT